MATAVTTGSALAQHAMSGGSDETLVASVMRAVPAAVGRESTIIDVNAEGVVRVVRAGTNNGQR